MPGERFRLRTVTMKRLAYLVMLWSVAIAAAATSLRAETGDAGPKASATRQRLSLEPVRVVYRHVEGTYLRSPHGIFVDKARSEIYVADTKNDLVAVYDPNGLPLFAFGYNGEVKEPLRAVSDPQGRIYVLAGAPRALKIFNYRGEYLRDFPFVDLEVEPDPSAITVGWDGSLYIADGASGKILVYDSEYRLRLAFRTKGSEQSLVRSVQGIGVDPEGSIYVADARATPAIQVYSPEGKFLRGWGEHESGPQNFSLPAGLAIDSEGRVIVVDTLRHAIVLFTSEGRFLARYGGKGTQPGAVTYPTDIAADGEGRVYVVERVGSRLQILQQRLVSTRGGGNARAGSNPFRERIRRELAEFMKTMR